MSEKLPKVLIIDASILFSFFKQDSARRRLIEELPNLDCELISPEFAFRELISDKDKVMKYSKISELSFEFLFSLLLRKVKAFQKVSIENFYLKLIKFLLTVKKLKMIPILP